jgi:DNA-binding response OmpR family regulator
VSANIVIFDDDTDVVELIKVILAPKGFAVHSYWELDNFLPKLEELQPCLVFMDYMVPPIGGKSAARQIKAHEQLGETPIVMISGVDNVEDVAEKAMADDYLKKPFEIAELDAIVKKLCPKEYNAGKKATT